MRPHGYALLLMTLSLAACGGVGGEPEIVATLVPEQATAAPLADDSVWQPDIANGARIFAERCVECHGVSGDGRGDLVLAGSVDQPIDMTDRSKVAAKTPQDWFEIITKGVIANLMPPWEDALSEAERWDVTLYAYSLAYDDELLALGERVWREKCGDCFPPSVIPPVFSDVAYGAILNLESFKSALSDAEAEAAVAYVRMKSLAGDREHEDKAGSLLVGAIEGRLDHGSAGGIVPRDTVVQLRYGKGEIGYSVAETTVDDSFLFRFEDIPLSTDIDYAVGVVYAGRLFSRRASARN